MKIAIVVHGRFHAFDLARELSRRHDVTVFTNYPKWAAQRFGLSPGQVRSFWQHGVATRAAAWLHNHTPIPFPEAAEHRIFGRWAAAQLRNEQWDVVHTFSGIAEEIMHATKGHAKLRMMVRASAHIRTQARILEDEELRTGARLDRPTPWIIAREEREYPLADRILLLSTFALNSMVDEGVNAAKLRLLPLGARLDQFRPPPEVVEARCARILSGAPLRVLWVGTLCYRKGMLDMLEVLRSQGHERFRFLFVGPVPKETKQLVKSLSPLAEIVSKQPQDRLPRWYAEGDLFVLPTLEDGFPVVLAQANAAGLPILTTPNCCGPDLIREGQTGWVLPIRSPRAYIERLSWCDSHREELAGMVRAIYHQFQQRTWADVAADFESICAEGIAENSTVDRSEPTHERLGVVLRHA
jgi:glycosyltransferase involved in cell wall biosynthesis